MVKAGNIKGVRAYVNNQEVGRTDKNGVLFIPSLGSFYDNRVSIEQKDIPMDYLLPQVRRTISPPLRSGSCVIFDARRMRAFVGKLRVADLNAGKPLEFYEVKVTAGGRTFSFPTGKDGEFYFENTDIQEKTTAAGNELRDCESIGDEEALSELKPGKYKATVIYKETPCSFDIDIPANDETFVDLGGMTCAPVPKPVSMPSVIATPEPAPPAPSTPTASSELTAIQPVIHVKELASSALPVKPDEGLTPLQSLETTPAPAAALSTPAKTEEVMTPLASAQTASALSAALSTKALVNVIPGTLTPASLPASFSIRQPFNSDMPSTVDDIFMLYDAAAAIMGTPDAVVYIEGHCDQLGTDAYNRRLGLKRAETVKTALVGMGVSIERIVSVKSFGKRRPVCRKDLSAQCRAENRRVVIRLGKPPKATKKRR